MSDEQQRIAIAGGDKMNDDTRHLIRLNPERAREIKKKKLPCFI